MCLVGLLLLHLDLVGDHLTWCSLVTVFDIELVVAILLAAACALHRQRVHVVSNAA